VTLRFRFTAAQKAELREPWKNGQSAAAFRGRWKGRIRPGLSGSWYFMEGYHRSEHPRLDLSDQTQQGV
jgi:hypothetical protein